jgi:hypothetical protein
MSTEVDHLHKVCVDPRRQWSEARNIWKNAGVRTVFYELSAPLRWVSEFARHGDA